MSLPLSLEIVATDISRGGKCGRNIGGKGGGGGTKNVSCSELRDENASCSELEVSNSGKFDGSPPAARSRSSSLQARTRLAKPMSPPPSRDPSDTPHAFAQLAMGCSNPAINLWLRP